MLRQQYNDKNAITEHTLTKYVVSALLLSSLMYAGLKLFNEIVSDAELLTYEMKQERFERALAFVHQNWNQRGQPTKLTLTFQFIDGKQQDWKVNVNKFGWPISVDQPHSKLNCDNIWRYLVLEQPQVRELDGVQVIQTRHVCRYEIRFSKNRVWNVEYNTENGRLVNK
jgi:hypothetical protein